MEKMIKLKCSFCKKPIIRLYREYKRTNIKRGLKHVFCSYKCSGEFQRKFPKQIKCLQCNSIILNPGVKKFCNHSCSASYQNKHKTKGTRVSKLEIWLQTKLINLYPKLEFHFNRKDIINSELDIYIPSLSLAFELNGIFHYEPIYGQEKLAQIQNNDSRKFQACLEKNISLVLIDTSSQKYFKESTSQKFLNIILNIIDKNLVTN